MPSFLDYQEKARKRTKRLVALYVLCLVGLVAAFCLIVAFGLHLGEAGTSDGFSLGDQIREHGGPLAATALAVLAVVGIATAVKTHRLGDGGTRVAESLGGRRVAPNTRDRLERRLLNVVEEMAIASGIAIPAVYVLDEEEGINAFAAGYAPNDAAVAVTHGALTTLSREELQSVVGHEFSHVLNGDMRLNVRLLASIFGIVCIAVFGRTLLRAGFELAARSRPRRSRDDKDPTVAIAFALMIAGAVVWVLGSLGVLFGRILQSSISRQREFLADASSVQFTRNPRGMAGALRTIGAVSGHGTLTTPRAAEVSHMLFAAGSLGLIFATHPPLESRIRRFEPGFNGDFRPTYEALRRRMANRRAGTPDDDDRDDTEGLRGVLAGAILRRAVRAEARRPAPSPGGASAPAPSAPSPAAAGFAGPVPGASVPPPFAPSPAAVGSVPGASAPGLTDDELASLRDPDCAPSALCAALLADEGPVRDAQLAAIRRAWPENGDARAQLALDWRRHLARFDAPLRRALCELAVETLRALPERDRRALADLLHLLVAADGAVTPFEFAVETLFRNRLLPPRPAALLPAHALAEPVRTVLFTLAHFGAASPDERTRAYGAGLSSLPPHFGHPAAMPEPELGFPTFTAALNRLRALRPADKASFLAACRAAALTDAVVTEDEDETLRAIAGTLDVPLAAPPPASA